MENAANAVARTVTARIGELPSRRSLVFVCGSGNNGGDGFAAARRFVGGSLPLQVFYLSSPEPTERRAAAENFRILQRAKAPLRQLERVSVIRRMLASEDCLVVDALFGTGLRRPVTGFLRDVVDGINRSGSDVVAVDVPSGLDCESGRILGSAIRAQVTVTFVAPKPGFFRGAGPRRVGRVVIGDLGLPPAFVRRFLRPLRGRSARAPQR